jgi:hypothetical protein
MNSRDKDILTRVNNLSTKLMLNPFLLNFMRKGPRTGEVEDFFSENGWSDENISYCWKSLTDFFHYAVPGECGVKVGFIVSVRAVLLRENNALNTIVNNDWDGKNIIEILKEHGNITTVESLISIGLRMEMIVDALMEIGHSDEQIIDLLLAH